MLTNDQIKERTLYGTYDPTIEFPDGEYSMPALTTVLHRLCGNDRAKFEEATRLINLFLDTALKLKDENT
jgi:hypothetical protein